MRCVDGSSWIRDVPRRRRFIVAIASVAASAWLFRGQVSSALVTRGDDFVQMGRPQQALAYYHRALVLDRGSTLAAERYAFTGLLIKSRSSLESAVAIASEALREEPGNEAILTDRALCLNSLGRFHDAMRDFEQLARKTDDARYYEFAAQAARRAGERRRARALFIAVLERRPGFPAAERELARLAL